MVPERDVDCGKVYDVERRRFVELLKSLDAEALAAKVPATPEWSVQDVLAHVVGIAADLNALNFETADPEAWTAAQVASRRDSTVDELAVEWDREAPAFEDGLRVLGYEIGSHFVADLLQHAADVRNVLGLSNHDDDEALAVALDFYLMSFEETLLDAKVGAVEVIVGTEHWTLGSGAVTASVRADRYELLRALGGRRTDAQIRALDWNGDAGAIVSIVSRYPVPVGVIEPS